METIAESKEIKTAMYNNETPASEHVKSETPEFTKKGSANTRSDNNKSITADSSTSKSEEIKEPTTSGENQKPSRAAVHKRSKIIHQALRFIVQVFFFVFFPSAFASAFAGVKYIFNQIGEHQVIELSSFVIILIGLLAYTFIFGRFFCGYACSFGSLNDWIFAIHRKFSKKKNQPSLVIPDKVMDWLSLLKYVLLAVIIFLCATRRFQTTTGMSPWDAFSQIRAGQFGALSGYVIGLIILGLLIIGMFFSERFFCRVFCPMGAVFSLIPVLPVFSLYRDRSSCIKGCSICKKVCPSDIDLPDVRKFDVPGDCFQCHKCVSSCPGSNIHCKAGKLRGDEILFTLIRVALLAGMFIWLSV